MRTEQGLPGADPTARTDGMRGAVAPGHTYIDERHWQPLTMSLLGFQSKVIVAVKHPSTEDY